MSQPLASPERAQPVTVLLVDDDAGWASLVRYMLKKTGGAYQLHWETSFSGGLAALVSGEYRLCLLDYRLGGGTGLDLLRQAMPLPAHTAVVLMPGLDQAELVGEAQEAGAVAVLVKDGLTAARLQEVLGGALGRG